MATFNQQPKSVEFSLQYSDGNGDRLKITYIESKPDIIIKAVDSILIYKGDIDWFIEVLEDVRDLINETMEKQ